MKAFLFLILSSTLLSAAPIYVVTESGNVTEDDRDIGEVATVIVTKLVDYKTIQPAIVAALAKSKADSAKALSDAQAAQASAQEEIAKAAKLRAACEEALAAGDIATLKALLQPAVDEAKQTERERRIAELQKQRDEIQRQIDEASRADAAAVEAVPARAVPAPKTPLRAAGSTKPEAAPKAKITK
jgi:hypothetical protein